MINCTNTDVFASLESHNQDKAVWFPIKEVVTHAGYFHADEVLSIAFLLGTGLISRDTPITRTNRPIEGMLSNNRVCVLDIGGDYNPELLNFDHHQNKDLPATDMLVLEHFGIPESMGGEAVKERLKAILFQRVSDIDRGLLKPDKENPILDFNGMIRAFNPIGEATDEKYNVQFFKALDFALTVLNNQGAVALKYQLDLERWKGLEKAPGIAFAVDTNMILCWKEEAAKENILFLVCPSLRGGWQVISRDTEVVKIPPYSGQTFLHNSGFLANYETFEEARAHAVVMVELWVWNENFLLNLG